jgi:hypothetical protein
MVRLLSIAALCLFLVTGQWAQGQNCSDAFVRLQNPREIRFVGEEAATMERRHRDFYIQAIEKVDKALLETSAILRVPDKPLEIEFRAVGQLATASPRKDRILISSPYQYYTAMNTFRQNPNSKTYTRHPVYSAPILMHEYGHAILRHNLRRLVPAYEKAFSLEEDMLSYVDQGKRIIGRYRAVKENASKEVLRQLEAEIKANMETFRKLNQDLQRPETQRLLETLTPFDEFFADLVAVSTTKNPKAIFLINHFPNEKLRMKKSQTPGDPRYDDWIYRDFSHENNRLESWSGRLKSELDHEALAPARHFLYESFLRYPRFQEGPGRQQLIDGVFLALVDSVQSSVASRAPMDSTEMNRLLIENIKRRLSGSSSGPNGTEPLPWQAKPSL